MSLEDFQLLFRVYNKYLGETLQKGVCEKGSDKCVYIANWVIPWRKLQKSLEWALGPGRSGNGTESVITRVNFEGKD